MVRIVLHSRDEQKQNINLTEKEATSGSFSQYSLDAVENKSEHFF